MSLDIKRIVIVGGGLAGCSAVLAAHAERQASGAQLEIVLVEKGKLGGNSARSCSGISTVTRDSNDTPELLFQDICKAGGSVKQELVEALVNNAEESTAMLEQMGINLGKVIHLGGHSVPRTHCCPAGANIGWTIMSSVLRRVKELSELKKQPIVIKEGFALEEILTEGGMVTGVRVSEGPEHDQAEVLPAQAVILATGGFSASKQLLKVHNPTAATLPTTNGPWATGECFAIAERAGARLVDMGEVQIHPTGFIDPNDPEAETKFLAPEKLREMGAILLNTSGKRFVDELSSRDRVSDAIMGQEGGWAWLLLPLDVAGEYGKQVMDIYARRNLLVKVEGMAMLSALLSVDHDELVEEIELYNEVLLGHEPDPFGKTQFPQDVFFGGGMYVAEVTPVVHYTMGGLDIDGSGRVLSQSGGCIEGLYAAGEACGGLHGSCRLGGNALLECVVFGRLTGAGAAKFVAG